MTLLRIDSDQKREEEKAKDWCFGHEDTCDLVWREYQPISLYDVQFPSIHVISTAGQTLSGSQVPFPTVIGRGAGIHPGQGSIFKC